MLNKNTKEFSNSITEREKSRIELEILQKRISDWNRKASIIQSNFDFILPNYMIDEILNNEEKKNYVNLHCLINCAVVNGRITESNGKLLKQIYN